MTVLYHRTTPATAWAIGQGEPIRSRETPPRFYVSDRLNGHASDYGTGYVAVHVEDSALEQWLDDEFPDGERHYTIPLPRAPYLRAFRVVACGVAADVAVLECFRCEGEIACAGRECAVPMGQNRRPVTAVPLCDTCAVDPWLTDAEVHRLRHGRWH